MKFTCLKILALILPISCTTIEENESKQKITLVNNVGIIDIDLNLPFDTTYSWVNRTDYKCGDIHMYRFADSKYSLPKESGFVYDFRPDSLLQFTVEHLEYPECYFKNDFPLDKEAINMIRQSLLLEYPETNVLVEKIESINGVKCIILGYERKTLGLHDVTLRIHPESGGKVLILEFRCLKRDCGNFIGESMESLRTMTFSGS